jgi:hypothetical protein
MMSEIKKAIHQLLGGPGGRGVAGLLFEFSELAENLAIDDREIFNEPERADRWLSLSRSLKRLAGRYVGFRCITEYRDWEPVGESGSPPGPRRGRRS